MEFPGTKLTALAQSCPSIFNPAWAWLYPLLRRPDWHFDSQFQDRRAAFQAIHDQNLWLSEETRSGLGSTLAYTAPMRRDLERLLLRLGAKTLLDLPCGDLNWMRHVRLPVETHYIGADIVASLVNKLKTEYTTEYREFRILDMVDDDLPAADLWLCRDALFHLSNRDIVSVLKSFTASRVQFILTTTYSFTMLNRDINPGGFRFINLQKPPFNWPPPATKIADFVVPWPPRYLALWSRESILALPRSDR